MKIWKTINKLNFDNSSELIANLKKKKIIISPWIDDIFKKKSVNLKIIKLPIDLFRVTVKDLGFKNPTELQKIYRAGKLNNLRLVDPVISLVCRELYLEQPIGEWLRFATPLKAMIDSDGVPHIPKLGKALNLFFIETYWSYPKAIFHPHNEFVFCK